MQSYKTQCERLQSDLKEIRSSKSSDEDRIKNIQMQTNSTLERLESENANLKNKIRDLDRLVEEYERSYNDLKVKEQALEKQNKNLENELDRMGEKSSSDEMHSQKLLAIEQANHVLEEELKELKEQQKGERAKVKEKMELLHQKQVEKVKKLEDANKTLEEKLVQNKLDENSTIQLFQKQCEELRKRIKELEEYESENAELKNSLKYLKTDMAKQAHSVAEEKKKLDAEKKDYDEMKLNYAKLNENIINLSRKSEHDKNELDAKLKQLQTSLDKKENELNELRRQKEADADNFLNKLSILNEENLSLAEQLKNVNSSSNVKEDELNKSRKKLAELHQENEKLQAQIKSYLNLENELVEVHMKNTGAQEHIHNLEAKIDDWERRYNKEINEYKSLNQQQLQQIKQLKQQLTAETLKVESLNADYALLKIECNKMDAIKQKCEGLEKELAESRDNKLKKINEYESSSKRYHETNDKYENEIKLLNAQFTSLVNKDLMEVFFFNFFF